MRRAFILRQIEAYMADHPRQRFGQVLFNLGINEFANPKDPSAEKHQLRDIYYDSDEKIWPRMVKVLAGQYSLTKIGPNEGTLMTRRKFEANARFGGLIDSDGHGVYATKKERSNITVHPSDIACGFVDFRVDAKLTHILWFNK